MRTRSADRVAFGDAMLPTDDHGATVPASAEQPVTLRVRGASATRRIRSSGHEAGSSRKMGAATDSHWPSASSTAAESAPLAPHQFTRGAAMVLEDSTASPSRPEIAHIRPLALPGWRTRGRRATPQPVPQRPSRHREPPVPSGFANGRCWARKGAWTSRQACGVTLAALRCSEVL